MSICSYCGEEKGKLTREHLFPAKLIEVYSQHQMCFTPTGNFKLADGQVIKDVCADCNNIKLGELDYFGNKLICDNFLQEFEEEDILKIKLDERKLGRWLIKLCYNFERINKSDASWFRNNLNFILNDNAPVNEFSVFAGLFVDMTAMPEWMRDEQPLQIFKNVPLLEIKETDLSFQINMANNIVKYLNGYYSIRLGNAKFLLFLYNSGITSDEKEIVLKKIQDNFSYVLIEKETVVDLKRVTDNISCLNHFVTGKNYMRQVDKMVTASLQGRNYKKVRDELGNKFTKVEIDNKRKMMEPFYLAKK